MDIVDDFVALLERDVCNDPVEWLEDNIYLDSIVSPNSPGPLSLANQPWAKQIIRDFIDPSIQHITLCTRCTNG